MSGTLSSSRNALGEGLLLDFTEGLAFDRQLYHQEVAVQKAWAKQLQALNVLSAEELENAIRLLNEAVQLMDVDKFDWHKNDEDIHMNLERFVTERAGELGKKMHLGRSRNDLIATTLRLKVADLCSQWQKDLTALIDALVTFSEKHLHIIIPGLTHMQHGQPVRLAHAMSAHAWAFYRDFHRLTVARSSALSVMPLGSGALSGTPLKIDEAAMAQDLGFAVASLNSYDSVSDRDFILEYLFCVETVATHLQRLAEDLIFYSSGAVSLIGLPKAWSTGSSMMPNKRNPDVLELTRGRVSRILGLCQSGVQLMRFVGLSYGSELHELKKTMLMVNAEGRQILEILPHFIQEMTVQTAKAELLLNHGHILATEIADVLTGQAMPFRDAYRAVAGLVELADQKSVQVHQIPFEDLPALVKGKISKDFWQDLSFESAVEKRQGLAGTSRQSVSRALNHLKQWASKPNGH